MDRKKIQPAVFQTHTGFALFNRNKELVQINKMQLFKLEFD